MSRREIKAERDARIADEVAALFADLLVVPAPTHAPRNDDDPSFQNAEKLRESA